MSKERYIVSVDKRDCGMNIKMRTLGKSKCECCCFWCFLQGVAPYLVIVVLLGIALFRMQHKSTEDAVSGTSISNVVRKVNVSCDIVFKVNE